MLFLECENLSPLFYKINIFLQKTATCIGLQVNIFFSILGVVFAVPFLFYFHKFQLFWLKNCEIIFTAMYFYLYELKKYVSDF